MKPSKILAWAGDQDDASVDPCFGRVGRQRIDDCGALGAKREETFDDEVLAVASDWLARTKRSGTPFFLWFNPIRMHQPIHVSPQWEGKSGHGRYEAELLHLDAVVGKLLDQLDRSGATANTIVVFTADNGVNLAHWPDSGTASFRGEKGTTRDGGLRVPTFIRWPPSSARPRPAATWRG